MVGNIGAVAIGGWKSKVGAGLMALGPFLSLFGLDPEIGNTVTEVGTAILGVGLAHKVAKLKE